MKFRKAISAFLAGVMIFLPASYVSADWVKNSDKNEPAREENIQEEESFEDSLGPEYKTVDIIAGLISELYIDSDYDKEEIIKMGLADMLKGNSPFLLEFMKSMAQSLDPYSNLYTYEEYTDHQDSMNNTSYGIGVILQLNEDYAEVTGFSENSAAEEAGVLVGDKIAAVDGKDVKGCTLNETVNKILGENNTPVSITVLRNDKPIDFVIVRRASISQSTVLTGGILKGNIGYVKILSFGNNTAEEFADAIDIMRERNVNKIIIDLRNNTGGYVSAAIDIAKMIVPKGKIIDVNFRDEEQNTVYTSELENPEFDIIVLVNENTASSSEILASAIQDSGVGKLVGKNTYGKAVIQSALPLPNGTVLYITTGKYLTRNGREINGVGLAPDVDVDNGLKPIDLSQYTQFDYNTRYTVGQSGDGVKSAIEKLYMLGLYESTPNSRLFTEELQDSLMRFQQGHNLVPSGILDIATQAAIDTAFSKLETTDDIQLERAYEMFGGSAADLY